MEIVTNLRGVELLGHLFNIHYNLLILLRTTNLLSTTTTSITTYRNTRITSEPTLPRISPVFPLCEIDQIEHADPQCYICLYDST